MRTNRKVSIGTICLLGLLLALLAALPAAATVAAQGPITPTPTPHLPQPAAPQAENLGGVAVQGNYAYVGHGNRLEIVNVSNPASPTYVGQSPNLGGSVYDIALSGNYAYAAIGGTGFLKVLNISNPAAPTVVGSYAARGSAEGIALSGSNVYLTDNVGLLIINITNPAAPTLTAAFNTPTSYTTSVVLSGSYAYIVDALSSKFYIINVSNPAAPTLSGSYNTSGWPGDVAVSGSYAHVMTWAPYRVVILNISNPAAPISVGSYPYAGSKGIRVIGNYSYVAAGDSFRVVNVSNPAAPTLTGTYSPLSSTWDMVVNGNYAYVTGDGLSIINIANPAAPNRVGFYDALDTTSPQVNFVAPVATYGTYEAYGETVQLRATATDDRGVTKVQFDWWDNTAQQRVLIGEDTTAPYEVNLNTNTLRPGCNIVNAGAFDAVGHFFETYIWVCLNPPAAPTLSTISNPEQDGAYLVSWSSVSGATGYELQEKLNSGAWQNVSGISGTSKNFTGKAAGTWCYQARASNNAGAGAWSASQCTTVAAANQPPNAPTNPNPANNTTNVAITAAVSWSGSDPENDALTYEVRFGTTNPPPTAVTSQSGTTYDPPGNLANSTTYYWQIVAKDAAHPSGTAGPLWSFTTTGGTPTFPNVFYISPAANVTVGGIAAQGADILRYTKSSNSWTMIYDGSVRGTLKNISAFALTDDGSLLLVFSANQVIAGLGTATPYDVVKFTPNTPGVFPLGAGTYSWFFQGRTKGLTTTAEKIDALDLVGVRLLLSTTGAASVPLPGGGVLKAADEDAFTYNPTNNEWLTPLRLDGSVVPGLAAEDVNGIWDDPQNDDYYLTILGVFNLGGLKGTDKSIVKLTPNGAGGWTPSLVEWLAPGAAFAGKIDALEIAR